MAFRYKAIDMTGRTSEDVLRSGSSVEEVTEELRRRGLFVVEISQIAEASTNSVAFLDRFRAGRRMTYVAGFLRQLSVLLSSGTALVQALGALERQAPDVAFREVLRKLRDSVEEGDSLAAAMKSHPLYFDPVCRGLIAAGEGGGNFNMILDRLALMVRQQCQVRSAVRGAMVYPSLLLAVSMGVVALMMGFVLPRFAGMFDTLGTEMPLPTMILLGINAWITLYWPFLMVASVLATAAVFWWCGSAAGRATLHRLAVTVPVIGTAVRSFCAARIARVLGMLLTNRVPLNEALQLTREVAGNQRFAAAVAAAEESITRGGTLSAALSNSQLFSPAVCEAIRSGEQAGRLGDLLTMVADYLDDENTSVLKSVTALIEPAILIIVGLFVGVIVLSMFLPLFDVAASAGGGS